MASTSGGGGGGGGASSTEEGTGTDGRDSLLNGLCCALDKARVAFPEATEMIDKLVGYLKVVREEQKEITKNAQKATIEAKLSRKRREEVLQELDEVERQAEELRHKAREAQSEEKKNKEKAQILWGQAPKPFYLSPGNESGDGAPVTENDTADGAGGAAARSAETQEHRSGEGEETVIPAQQKSRKGKGKARGNEKGTQKATGSGVVSEGGDGGTNDAGDLPEGAENLNTPATEAGSIGGSSETRAAGAKTNGKGGGNDTASGPGASSANSQKRSSEASDASACAQQTGDDSARADKDRSNVPAEKEGPLDGSRGDAMSVDEDKESASGATSDSISRGAEDPNTSATGTGSGGGKGRSKRKRGDKGNDSSNGSDGELSGTLKRKRGEALKAHKQLAQKDALLGQWGCVAVMRVKQKEKHIWYTYMEKVGSNLETRVWVAPPTKLVKVTNTLQWEEVDEWSVDERSQLKDGVDTVRDIEVERFRTIDEVAEFVRTTETFTRLHAQKIQTGWCNEDNLFSVDELKKGMGERFVERNWMESTRVHPQVFNAEAHMCLKTLCGIST